MHFKTSVTTLTDHPDSADAVAGCTTDEPADGPIGQDQSTSSRPRRSPTVGTLNVGTSTDHGAPEAYLLLFDDRTH